MVRPGINAGMPLGGIGTGSFELRGDGLCYEWQIFNNHPWGTGPATGVMERDGLYFGLVVRSHGQPPRCLLLAAPGPFHSHLNDPYKLPWVEFPESITFEGAFPRARLRFASPGSFPVTVDLTGCSPFIPLDSKNSGLPAAVFTVKIENNLKERVDVSVFAALKNSVMYDVPQAKHEVFWNGSGIVMARESEDYGRASFGSLALTVLGDNVSYTCDCRSLRQVWEPLMSDGSLALPEKPAGQALPYGFLARRLAIGPQSTESARFVLSWFFPNHYEAACRPDAAPVNIGHRYAEWFNDAEEVGSYVLANFEYLATGTQQFLDCFYKSSLDRWILDAVNAQLTTLVKSSWWDREGRFGIWEGLGCCGLQTMDITHYGSFPIVQLFPELQKSQMRLTTSNVEDGGRIPHMMPGAFGCGDDDPHGRIDIIPQFILNVWRDMLWTGDLKYTAEMFPFVKNALAFMRTKDTDGDGLPNNKGTDQTYDQFPMHGTTAFVGLMHAASVMAAGEIAAELGDQTYAEACKAEYPALLAELEQQLWNGRFYRLSFDKTSGRADDGCMLDQMNAEWFVRMTGRPGILPPDKVKSALEAMIRLNRSPYGFWMNCAWENREKQLVTPRERTDQAGTPWTGIEYMFASHLILEGLTDKGIGVLRDVWERHERRGLRYNHIECGEHYYRAMSAWAVYLALAGFGYDALRKGITFRAGEETFSGLFAVPGAWGMVTVPPADQGRFLLEVHRGIIELSAITFRGLRAAAGQCQVNGTELACTATALEGSITINFGSPVSLRMGSELQIEFTNE